MRSPLTPLAILVAAGVLAGCADRVSLLPAPGATRVPVEGEAVGAVETVSDVRVAVISREWPGRANISSEVTPLKVDIRNNSDQPVLIRYSEFKLVRPNGEVYSAVPPFAIDETVTMPRLAAGYPRITTPGFAATRFNVAPLYSPMFPGLPVSADPFPSDPGYYGNYGDYWRRVTLPTPAMVRLALPEGVLQPGGHMQGYLYFEEVDPDAELVHFRMDLMRAGGGRDLGTIDIPFRVT